MDFENDFIKNPRLLREWQAGHEQALDLLRTQTELLNAGKPDFEAVKIVVLAMIEAVRNAESGVKPTDVGFLAGIASQALNHSLNEHAQAADEMAGMLNKVWR